MLRGGIESEVGPTGFVFMRLNDHLELVKLVYEARLWCLSSLATTSIRIANDGAQTSNSRNNDKISTPFS